MYKRILSVFLFIFSFLLVFSTHPVFARNLERFRFPSPDRVPDIQIPERNGIYDIPGFPGFKVRVFVHNAKTPPSSSAPLVCTVSDPGSEAVVHPTEWYLPDGEWEYNLNPYNLPGSISPTTLETIARDAFGRWSTAVGSNKVTFSKGANALVNRARYDGKNLIAWGTTSSSALAVTYIWYYPSNGQVAEVDTIMNKRYSWSWTPYALNACVKLNTYDAQDILTHELGHWVGLDDEYTDNYVDNTMYGYGSKAEIKKDTLTSGDVAGVTSIYNK